MIEDDPSITLKNSKSSVQPAIAPLGTLSMQRNFLLTAVRWLSWGDLRITEKFLCLPNVAMWI
ncbi:hypothetical protein I8751_11380 [Nostocaceae cyanobacterium CENA357]|uniref:Uncharacterized protein n=1 Tax=Atlanticothrix silvestris CENA357 TaxID=1725252 RepID=A0A8J7HDF4_9CYAN|nr:hypothetical protein [Atlanticothrix silvestris]MBH8552958.1 hypothetical protein [Atlanticothrix silvestris CENA357]